MISEEGVLESPRGRYGCIVAETIPYPHRNDQGKCAVKQYRRPVSQRAAAHTRPQKQYKHHTQTHTHTTDTFQSRRIKERCVHGLSNLIITIWHQLVVCCKQWKDPLSSEMRSL